VALKIKGTLIAYLTKVSYPALSAKINWPVAWPNEWAKNDATIANDGSFVYFDVVLQAAADNGVQSNTGDIKASCSAGVGGDGTLGMRDKACIGGNGGVCTDGEDVCFNSVCKKKCSTTVTTGCVW
jgi:hypothetical protein